ncbi:MAG: TRAP transporter small permease [Synergistaceae bacterium]|jgi:TRAP-type C4-dicarboxylate transport system permease small subunit|nr:TRAP transporter small permease [Synergistaceae bacterium]
MTEEPVGTYRKTLDFFQRFAEYALFSLLAAMVVIVFAQVIFRFVLRASLPWSEEAARYIMVWISMLGAAIGIRRKGHIGVEAVVMLLPAILRKAVAVLATAVAAGFFLGVVVYGVAICQVVAGQESPAMEISMAIPYSSLVAGGFLMLLYALEEFLNLTVCPRAPERNTGRNTGKNTERGAA